LGKWKKWKKIVFLSVSSLWVYLCKFDDNTSGVRKNANSVGKYNNVRKVV
jgi:hypothetical protein